MSNTELIKALKQAAKRADYYQTGERELFTRTADALEAAGQQLADARHVIAEAKEWRNGNRGMSFNDLSEILAKYPEVQP